MSQSGNAGAKLLARLLYVSDLSPGTSAIEVSRIVGSSRRRNAGDGITGLLIFDGGCFCQYVEGPLAALTALNDRLDLDPRHTHMEVLLKDVFAGPRRFSDWRLGYVDVVDGDEIGAMRNLSGDDALAAFERLLPLLDVHV